MVTRAKKDGVSKKKKIKVLSLKKETVKNLTRDEASGVKGGTGVCLSRPGFSTSVARSGGIVTSSGASGSSGAQSTASFHASY